MPSGDAGGRGSPCPPALSRAAQLSACGLNVIPLTPDSKRPAVPWKQFATGRLYAAGADTVERYLTSWWGEGEYGLGVVTGEVSGIVVVDVDSEEAQEVYDEHAGDIRTVAARTRKGRHYWFRHPGSELGNRAAVGGVPLDVRGDGGYVVVPPTQIEGHTYQWIISPFVREMYAMWPPAPLPEALRELLWPRPRPRVAIRRAPAKTERGGRYVAAALERETAAVAAAPEGIRNHTLNKAAYSLARFLGGGLSEAEISEALAGAARQAGLPEHEAAKTIESGLRSR